MKFDGDTVINDLTYKKMWQCTEESLDNWYSWGFIRENENGEVFTLPPDYIEGKVYDFGVSVGDSIEARNLYLNSDTLYYLVTSVDSVLLLDGYRKQITLYEYKNDKEEIWVEGLGSWYGILNSGNNSYGGGACGSYSALCYEEGGTLVYQDPEYSTCHFNQLVSMAENEFSVVKIYPNPAQNILHIDFESNDITDFEGEVKIINSLGAKIFEKKLGFYKNVLYLHKVDRGIHFIFLTNSDNNYPPYKLIVD